MSRGRQKSYVDVWRTDLLLDVDDLVYLKISPMKGVMLFGNKETISSRYVGLYHILRCITKLPMT